MRPTLGTLLDREAARIVGRDRERAALLRLVGADRPLVVQVHGLAGVGKSALLQAFAQDARREGAAVVALDGRAVEPTERGFLAALRDAVPGAADEPGTEPARVVGELAECVVVTLDSYEAVALLDDWLREVFLPSAPDNVRLVLAGRDRPSPGWATRLGELFFALQLRNLEPAAATELLARSGTDAIDAARLNRLARGHPLTLRLAAAALADRPAADLAAAAAGAVLTELTRVYLAGLDRTTRRVLDAASVVRRPTRAVLAAMLPELAADEAVERLRGLPFVEVAADGLVLHDTVRETVAAALHSVDPAAYRRYRAAAWRELRRELAAVHGKALWRTTADTLYLLDEPMIRDSFFPTDERTHLLEPATPADRAEIGSIAARHGPAALVRLVEQWWEAQLDAFRVARAADGAVDAFTAVCDANRLPHRLVEADPVVRTWRDDLRRNPMPGGRCALGIRFMLSAESGEHASPARAACWLDVKREYLALRPALRRTYTALESMREHGPIMQALGFGEVPGSPVDIGGVAFHVIVLDFGPSSVDGWLADLVTAGLEVDDVLDVRRRQLVVAGERIDLTPLELDLVRYLRDRDGDVAERRAILRDVWGTEWAGGSNVVEAVVSGLRRKLGKHADLIETVRGVGYRLRAV